MGAYNTIRPVQTNLCITLTVSALPGHKMCFQMTSGLLNADADQAKALGQLNYACFNSRRLATPVCTCIVCHHLVRFALSYFTQL